MDIDNLCAKLYNSRYENRPSHRPIYQFLATGTEALAVLTGIRLSGAYQFSSPTLKGSERRIDAMFASEGAR
ncbi:hypothetical protein TI04_11955 [Achromatium sp. WMS2]|nr:hypothetical protein TI04_11955 [Achromatium sp. WMS2]